jgi:hypothetical protein
MIRSNTIPGNPKPSKQPKAKSTPPSKQPKAKSTPPSKQPKASTATKQPKAKPTTPITDADADEIKETIQDNYLYTKLSYILFFINLTLLIFSIINIVELAECEKNPSKNCPRPYALEKGAKSQDNVNGCYTLLPDQGGKKKRL